MSAPKPLRPIDPGTPERVSRCEACDRSGVQCRRGTGHPGTHVYRWSDYLNRAMWERTVSIDVGDAIATLDKTTDLLARAVSEGEDK